MATSNQIRAEGTVVEVMDHEAYRVALANGHRCVARISAEDRDKPIALSPGNLVRLEFHPYDLSRARLISILSD